MDVHVIKEMARLALTQASCQTISNQLGCSKSTVQRHLQQLKAHNITLEQAITMSASSLKIALQLDTAVRCGYYCPDFEHVYCVTNIKGTHKRTLKACWESYCASAPEGASVLQYKGFCKAYSRFCENLPIACREVQLTHQWQFGDVAMIDYSGNGVVIRDNQTQSTSTAQIFVGVLAGSGYIFCCATPRQTRDDWLDAQVKMMNFFDGAPRHIYLDNSTSLVLKADKFNPKISDEYRSFCDYYGVLPVAVRPNHPRDKGLVENAVKQVQKSILNSFKGREFFDIETLNKAILRELERLNTRALTTRSEGLSRYDLYLEEKPTLRPLPPIPYDLSSETKILKVQKNYLIRFNNQRFSVPAVYIGRKVRAIASRKVGTLSVYDLETGERIALHYIDRLQHTSISPDHMPVAHRAVLTSVADLKEALESCGPHSIQMCSVILEHNRGEIVRKLLRRLNSLRTSLGNDVFESCCKQTLKCLNPSYERLNDELCQFIGHQTTHSTRTPTPEQLANISPQTVRGAEYYESMFNNKKKEKR